MLKEYSLCCGSSAGYSIPLVLIIHTHVRQMSQLSRKVVSTSVKYVQKSSILLVVSTNTWTHILSPHLSHVIIVVKGFAVFSIGQNTSETVCQQRNEVLLVLSDSSWSLDLELSVMNMKMRINVVSCNAMLSVTWMMLNNITRKISQKIWLCMWTLDCLTYISQISSSSMGKECLQPSHITPSKRRNILSYIYSYLITINLMGTGVRLPLLVRFPGFIRN
jgi:hypothetical protein